MPCPVTVSKKRSKAQKTQLDTFRNTGQEVLTPISESVSELSWEDKLIAALASATDHAQTAENKAVALYNTIRVE